MISFDNPMHHMTMQCDGKPTPPHCAVAISSVQMTRDLCQQEFYQAGWRLYKGKQLCASCCKRALAQMEQRKCNA